MKEGDQIGQDINATAEIKANQFQYSEKMVVYWQTIKPTLDADQMKKILQHSNNINADRIIIIVNQTSPQARKVEQEFKMTVEIFLIEDLQFNITNHHLVPHHSVLDDDQKSELMSKYRIRENQLPKISPEDPVAKYFGVQLGQVMKITRSSETAGRYVTYRIVKHA